MSDIVTDTVRMTLRLALLHSFLPAKSGHGFVLFELMAMLSGELLGWGFYL